MLHHFSSSSIRGCRVDPASNTMVNEREMPEAPPIAPVVDTTDNRVAAQAKIREGIRRQFDGEYELAATQFTYAIRLSPTSRAYALRAEVYCLLGEFARSIADYGAAIRLDSTNAAAYVGRARV